MLHFQYKQLLITNELALLIGDKHMSKVQIEDLLLAGSHFGHLTRRWNPKMRKYIFMERNGIHIIDLKKPLI